MIRPLSWFFRHIVLLVFLGFILVGVLYRQEIFGTAAEDATTVPADAAGTERESLGEQASVDAAVTDRPEMESAAESSLPLE